MILRFALGTILGAPLAGAALAQSLDAPAGIPAASAPGGLTGSAAPGCVGRFVQRSGMPASVGGWDFTTGSVRGERLR